MTRDDSNDPERYKNQRYSPTGNLPIMPGNGCKVNDIVRGETCDERVCYDSLYLFIFFRYSRSDGCRRGR